MLASSNTEWWKAESAWVTQLKWFVTSIETIGQSEFRREMSCSWLLFCQQASCNRSGTQILFWHTPPKDFHGTGKIDFLALNSLSRFTLTTRKIRMIQTWKRNFMCISISFFFSTMERRDIWYWVFEAEWLCLCVSLSCCGWECFLCISFIFYGFVSFVSVSLSGMKFRG